MGETENPIVRHEESDVNIRGILGFAAGLFVAAILIYFLVWLLFIYFNTREAAKGAPQYPLAAGEETRLPPEPRLQTTPRQDMQNLRALEEETLNSYRWVDRNAGVVRIPIGEAMRLTLERGLPTRPASQEQPK